MTSLLSVCDRWLARCVRCGEAGTVLCPQCQSLLSPRTTSPDGYTAHAIGCYDERLAELIRRMKYAQETRLAGPLARALGLSLVRHSLNLRRAILLPVPLHPARLAERGYNQSALVARALAASTGCRVVTGYLVRRQQTSAQAKLGKAERQANMQDAFAVAGFRSEGRWHDGRYFLVDDVVTTGHTADACARALLGGGIALSGVLACALKT